jgi:hypothetical protein
MRTFTLALQNPVDTVSAPGQLFAVKYGHIYPLRWIGI